MARPLLRFLPPLLSLALALGLFLHVRAFAAQDDTAPFHQKVREAVAAIPVRIGDWEGADRKIPPAAGKLLKPNTLFCRQYRQVSTGRGVTVLLVHCRDARDMTGHYPPICYPGHGWTLDSWDQKETIPLWGGEATFAVYQFSRTEVRTFLQCTIYNLFVLPRAGLVTEMDQVVKSSGDYRVRPYGAAQVQVIFDSGMPEWERLDALRVLLAPLGPVVESMRIHDGGNQS